MTFAYNTYNIVRPFSKAQYQLTKLHVFVGIIDVKNISLQIKNIKKTCFLNFYKKTLKKTFIKNIKLRYHRNQMFKAGKVIAQ